MSHEVLLQIEAQIVSQVTKSNAYSTSQYSCSAVNAKYSRNHELEADYYSIQ